MSRTVTSTIIKSSFQVSAWLYLPLMVALRDNLYKHDINLKTMTSSFLSCLDCFTVIITSLMISVLPCWNIIFEDYFVHPVRKITFLGSLSNYHGDADDNVHCVKAKIFLSILDSNMSLWRYTILEYSRRTQYVTYTWNIRIEYGGIRSVHNRSWIFVKVYHTSVVLLEYDDEPFVKKLWKKVTVQVHSKI